MITKIKYKGFLTILITILLVFVPLFYLKNMRELDAQTKTPSQFVNITVVAPLGVDLKSIKVVASENMYSIYKYTYQYEEQENLINNISISVPLNYYGKIEVFGYYEDNHVPEWRNWNILQFTQDLEIDWNSYDSSVYPELGTQDKVPLMEPSDEHFMFLVGNGIRPIKLVLHKNDGTIEEISAGNGLPFRYIIDSKSKRIYFWFDGDLTGPWMVDWYELFVEQSNGNQVSYIYDQQGDFVKQPHVNSVSTDYTLQINSLPVGVNDGGDVYNVSWIKVSANKELEKYPFPMTNASLTIGISDFGNTGYFSNNIVFSGKNEFFYVPPEIFGPLAVYYTQDKLQVSNGETFFVTAHIKNISNETIQELRFINELCPEQDGHKLICVGDSNLCDSFSWQKIFSMLYPGESTEVTQEIKLIEDPPVGSIQSDCGSRAFIWDEYYNYEEGFSVSVISPKYDFLSGIIKKLK